MKTAKNKKEKQVLRPKAVPSLTTVQFRVVTKDMQRQPSEADIKRIERAKEILKNNQFFQE